MKKRKHEGREKPPVPTERDNRARDRAHESAPPKHGASGRPTAPDGISGDWT